MSRLTDELARLGAATVYEASAEVLLNQRVSSTLSSLGDLESQDPLRYAETQVRIAQTPALAERVKKATGLGGRIRQVADDRDRVRKAVGNAIRRAVRDIGYFDRPLAEHLQVPRLRCGAQ